MDPSSPSSNQPSTENQLEQPAAMSQIQPLGLPRAEGQRLTAHMAPNSGEQVNPAANLPPAPVAPPPAPLYVPAPEPQIQPTQAPVVPQQPTDPAQVTSDANSPQAPVKPANHPHSTQNSLQIAEVRDGIVIMNDGSYRAVVMVKSINFDLMSNQEQEAVEYSYQGFLNSLYFPVQIFIRSQKVDLQPYIEKLDKIRSEHDNMLLALLMEDYIGYIDALSEQTNIMDKKFYVIIPFFPVVNAQQALTQSKDFLSGLGGLFKKQEQHVVINEPDLENAKTELRNRVQSVLSGLLQCGIQGLPLDTQELIELYYDTYNPDTATRQPIKDFGALTADVVTKGTGAAPQAHLQRELQ
jgi:hypothetical protein